MQTLKSKIEHWDDERGIGNSLIVTLVPGFAFRGNDSRNAEHVFGFNTVKDARAAVRQASSCNCDICLSLARPEPLPVTSAPGFDGRAPATEAK